MHAGVNFALSNRLKWESLFDPVIKMCNEGFKLTVHTGEELYFSLYIIFCSAILFRT